MPFISKVRASFRNDLLMLTSSTCCSLARYTFIVLPLPTTSYPSFFFTMLGTCFNTSSAVPILPSTVPATLVSYDATPSPSYTHGIIIVFLLQKTEKHWNSKIYHIFMRDFLLFRLLLYLFVFQLALFPTDQKLFYLNCKFHSWI